MSADPLPPLFGHAPALACGRWLGDGPCGAEPTHHVIWTVGADNGLVCAAHAKEALRWVYYAMHPYRMECSIGGAMFDHSANVCVVADLPVQGEPPK